MLHCCILVYKADNVFERENTACNAWQSLKLVKMNLKIAVLKEYAKQTDFQ